MLKKPIENTDPLYMFLREGKIKEFNARKTSGKVPNLRDTDMRGLDLRGMDASGLDMSNCYFRQTDLRGIDFSQAKLGGASINGAKISGCLFPKELSAEEITMSLLHGTRLRYGK
jgi:uncharacterized protein YjbI with pentapeptide repeats